ncbi:hypothetical protein DENIT_180007 [Pseudomonas veronii]|nr:hypothetical protein DENIT_180007 [Pseudomonas veronii]
MTEEAVGTINTPDNKQFRSPDLSHRQLLATGVEQCTPADSSLHPLFVARWMLEIDAMPYRTTEIICVPGRPAGRKNTDANAQPLVLYLLEMTVVTPPSPAFTGTQRRLSIRHRQVNTPGRDSSCRVISKPRSLR